jgi:mRNA interferase MazF
VKGKIVLVPFPFTDLTASKLRPALVLMEGERDCVVAFISSRVPAQPSSTQVLIQQNHRDFPMTGLKTSSVVVLDKIATISRNLILGEIGELGKSLREEVNRILYETYRL